MIRLGRISYVNMAPLFFELDADVEEVPGVPTELNQALLDGKVDLAPISSIEYARHAADLRILPRVCVSSEGAVDSIQLVSKAPLRSIRSVAVTPESATSVVLTRVLLPEAEHVPLGEDADATLLIGDAALKSMFEDPTPHYDLGRLWLEETGLPMVYAVFACADPPPEGMAGIEAALIGSHEASLARPEELAELASDALRLPGRVPRPLLREAPLPLRPTRARRAAHLLRARPRRRPARACARAQVRRDRAGARHERHRSPRPGALGRADLRRRTRSSSCARATSSRSAAPPTSCGPARPSPIA